MKITLVLFVAALLFVANGFTYAGHTISGDASKQVAEGIKTELLANLDRLANQTVADQLRSDLAQTDDKKRTLTSIDVPTANQIFSLFGLVDPGCDKDNNGYVEKDELKCLNRLWKCYVPK